MFDHKGRSQEISNSTKALVLILSIIAISLFTLSLSGFFDQAPEEFSMYLIVNDDTAEVCVLTLPTQEGRFPTTELIKKRCFPRQETPAITIVCADFVSNEDAWDCSEILEEWYSSSIHHDHGEVIGIYGLFVQEENSCSVNVDPDQDGAVTIPSLWTSERLCGFDTLSESEPRIVCIASLYADGYWLCDRVGLENGIAVPRLIDYVQPVE